MSRKEEILKEIHDILYLEYLNHNGDKNYLYPVFDEDEKCLGFIYDPEMELDL